jgi:MFS family permease
MPSYSEKDSLNRFNAGFFSARVGEWIYVVALNWLVLAGTNSPWLLAVVNACRLAPSLALSLPGGFLADRYDPRRLSLFNNLLNGVAMLAVGVALTLKFAMPWVCLLVLLQAAITALEAPFRNTLMNRLYDGRRLKAAIAHNASLMNAGRIVGPVVAGALLVQAGPLLTFVVAALGTALFSVVIATLEVSTVHSQAKRSRVPAEDFSLWSTLGQNRELRNVLLLAAPMMFFGFPYTAMLSVLTDTLLGLGPEQLGALTAISAAGALAASSMLGLRPELSSWRATLRYATLFALSLCALSFAQGFASAALALFMVGYLGQAYRSCSRMHLHDLVPKEVAGRVLGLSLMDRGMIPLGGLLLGAITELCSARVSYGVMGVGCLLTVLMFYRSAKVAG